ncbi:MAG: hypothetical protein QXM32_07755, partial [Nitrososphaerota archaeon]
NYNISIDSRRVLAIGTIANIPLLEKWGYTGNAMLELFKNNVIETMKKMMEELKPEKGKEDVVFGPISESWHRDEELRKEVEINFPQNLKKAIDEYEIIIHGLVDKEKLRNILSKEYELRGYEVSYEFDPSKKYKDIVIKRDDIHIIIHMENMVNKLLFKGYDLEALINEMTLSLEVFSQQKRLMEMMKKNEKIDFISYVPYKKEITFDDVPTFKMPF